MNHKILLVGSGAREHAIAKTLKRSNQSNEVFCIGSNMNPGIEKICSKIIIQDCNNPEIILNYAVSNSIFPADMSNFSEGSLTPMPTLPLALNLTFS